MWFFFHLCFFTEKLSGTFNNTTSKFYHNMCFFSFMFLLSRNDSALLTRAPQNFTTICAFFIYVAFIKKWFGAPNKTTSKFYHNIRFFPFMLLCCDCNCIGINSNGGYHQLFWENIVVFHSFYVMFCISKSIYI